FHIEPEEAVAVGPDPEFARAVLTDRDHVGAGRALGGRPVGGERSPPRVDPVERIWSADPQRSLTVRVERAHAAVDLVAGPGRPASRGTLWTGRVRVAKCVIPTLPSPAHMLPSRSAKRFSTLSGARLSGSSGSLR